jgi:hypothetical protein
VLNGLLVLERGGARDLEICRIVSVTPDPASIAAAGDLENCTNVSVMPDPASIAAEAAEVRPKSPIPPADLEIRVMLTVMHRAP